MTVVGLRRGAGTGSTRHSVPPLVMSVWAGSVSAVTMYLTHVGVRDRASQRQMTGPYLKDATEVRPKFLSLINVHTQVRASCARVRPPAVRHAG